MSRRRSHCGVSEPPVVCGRTPPAVRGMSTPSSCVCSPSQCRTLYPGMLGALASGSRRCVSVITPTCTRESRRNALSLASLAPNIQRNCSKSIWLQRASPLLGALLTRSILIATTPVFDRAFPCISRYEVRLHAGSANFSSVTGEA